jgi:hypothetical protein
VTANSVHPGVVSASNFGKTLGSDNLFKSKYTLECGFELFCLLRPLLAS